jgi:hypothetical protein
MKIKMNDNQEILLEIAIGLSMVVTALILVVGIIEIFKK